MTMDAAAATVHIVENSNLLLAVIIPLFGSLVVMTLKNHPNLREMVSSCSSILLFLLVLSFIPALKAGETLVYPIFKLLPGLSITLRADGFSMIFAMVASSLWICEPMTSPAKPGSTLVSPWLFLGR
jgi:multicomponent Na+:H+ antiporter subunit D